MLTFTMFTKRISWDNKNTRQLKFALCDFEQDICNRTLSQFNSLNIDFLL